MNFMTSSVGACRPGLCRHWLWKKRSGTLPEPEYDFEDTLAHRYRRFPAREPLVRAATDHLRRFRASGRLPPLTGGVAVFEAVRGTSVPAAGALAVAEAAGATVVPLAWTLANPAGPIQDEAF